MKRMTDEKNVLGGELVACSYKPITGFFRNGCCESCDEDFGVHTVCAEMTEEFLIFSKSRGNDLSTPRPEFNFPGLKPGDRWCLCAPRWQEAFLMGHAPNVILESTNIKTLEVVDLENLKKFAVPILKS
ncbi:MAG: DUF2237 domain-containing protein [Leptospiraceae bacterium]|nr:DUF2237 domain-containing protein [Leptospiraceae bacterium]